MKKGMTYKELSRFYNDIAVFVKSGLTVVRGLDTLKQGKRRWVFWMLDNLRFHVEKGGTLWEGMRQFPDYFDEFQVLSIRAGEESGKLPDTCRGLSRYYETRHKERQRLIAGLLYPVILLHAVVLLPPLKYLVLPNLDRSYFSIVLPPLVIAYLLIGLGYWGWNSLSRTGPVRETIEETILKLPLIGKLARGMALARVLRALANLSDSGIEAVKAARQAIGTAGNSSIARSLTGALPVLENGGTFTDFFSFSGVLPSMQLGIVAVGEQTGTMTDSLEKMVNQMEEDNRQRLTTTIKAAGALAYIIAAIVVSLTIISFYTGYFKF